MIKIPSPSERAAMPAGAELPYIYSPFEYAGRVRFKCAGIASEEGFRPEWSGSIAIVEAKSPGSVIVERYMGDQLSAEELAATPHEFAAARLAALA